MMLHLCSLGQEYLPVCVCVCVCVCVRLEREMAMFSHVIYLMIMEAYGVCVFFKLLGMILVLRLVWHVFVVIAILLYLINEWLVVNWTALWGLIKIDYFVFTWRLSLRRRCPKWICPRWMTPRWMSPRRTSPRRVAQMGGAGGWTWEEKPGSKGPPFSWLCVPGTSFCAIWLGPPSLGDGWRRDGSLKNI